MQDIIIKGATLENIKDITNLNQELFNLEAKNFDFSLNTSWPTSSDGQEYYKNAITNGITLIAIKDNIVVGYLIGSINTENSYNTKSQAELENMCISNSYRHFGIGTLLFNEFKNICKEKDIKELKVTASYKNKKAISFYKKNGFEEKEITLKQDI